MTVYFSDPFVGFGEGVSVPDVQVPIPDPAEREEPDAESTGLGGSVEVEDIPDSPGEDSGAEEEQITSDSSAEEIQSLDVSPSEAALRRTSIEGELRIGGRRVQPARRRQPPPQYDPVRGCFMRDGEPAIASMAHLPTVPKSVKEALESECAAEWQDAMQAEMDRMDKMGVYTLVDPPEGANILDPKWVWAIKTKGDGTLDKFKARMVVRGFKQIEGVDFDETYAPVGRYGTARVLLALAAAMDWEVHQMDVTTAFLYGDLEEDIYMRQPEGFNDGSGRVWKLRKSLYGLKQAPRVWNAKLDKVLKGLGLEQSILDPALYFLKRDGEVVFILDFVDDMLIVGSAMSIVDYVKESLCSHFDMKDLGEAEYYLGMHIKRNRSTRELWLGQEKYCAQAIERYGLQGESPVDTPMATDFKAKKKMKCQAVC